MKMKKHPRLHLFMVTMFYLQLRSVFKVSATQQKLDPVTNCWPKDTLQLLCSLPVSDVSWWLIPCHCAPISHVSPHHALPPLLFVRTQGKPRTQAFLSGFCLATFGLCVTALEKLWDKSGMECLGSRLQGEPVITGRSSPSFIVCQDTGRASE